MNRETLKNIAVADYRNAKTLTNRNLVSTDYYDRLHSARAVMRAIDRWHRHPHIDPELASRCIR